VVLDCALSQEIYSDISFLTNDTSINTIANFIVYQECDFNLENLIHFYKKFDEVIVAIGNNNVRLNKSNYLLENGIKLATLIHSHALVSRFSKIEDGTVIFANAVINPFSNIGRACIINTGVVVEHDCKIEDGVHISPNASIAGTVSIGEKSWVCVGGVISNNINVGSNSVVGAGGVVVDDVPSNVLVAGVPAKIKKYYHIENTT